MRLQSFVLAINLSLAASGQAFEVISVKTLPFQRGQIPSLEFGCSADGRFVSKGQNPSRAILYAFDIKPFQLKNLAGWATSLELQLDIEAKAASGVTQEQCRRMVQLLLADRFQLRTHREDQMARVVVLTLGKDGPRMPRPAEGSTESGVKLTINGQQAQAAPGAPRDLKPPVGWSMSQLADNLGIAFAFDGGRPVVDRTGLEGLFRITLDFGVVFPGQQQTLEFPDVSSAIQKLGLKLEERTEPFPMLVIDRFEKPGEN